MMTAALPSPSDATRAQESSLTADQMAQFRRNGFVVVQQLFSPDEIAEIRDTFMEMVKHGPVEGLSETKPAMNRGDTSDYAPNDPLKFFSRMLHPHNHLDKPVGPLSMKYMLHPKLEPILTALFAEEPVAVQSMFYFKPPESRGQALHQDNFICESNPGPVSPRGWRSTMPMRRTAAWSACGTRKAIRFSVPSNRTCRSLLRPSM